MRQCENGRMNDGEWLTQEELAELTGSRQGATQLRRLADFGVRGFRRPDGSVVASRWALRMKAAGVDPETKHDAGINWTKRARGPNWKALADMGRVPGRGVSPQPGQAEMHVTQRATAGSRVGTVSQRVCRPSSCM